MVYINILEEEKCVCRGIWRYGYNMPNLTYDLKTICGAVEPQINKAKEIELHNLNQVKFTQQT